MAVLEITVDNFEKEVLKSKKPVLVDFWAEWCSHCQPLGPVMEALAEKYEGRAVIGKINTDEEQALAMSFQITGIPTVIFFKDGKEIDRLVGVMPPDAFIQVLEKHL